LKSVIYYNIKPKNFLIEINKKGNLVYIINFGLIKKYRNLEISIYKSYYNNYKFKETSYYININNYLGINKYNPTYNR
jgi:casein kinase I family protein HRR25